ncbi:MAG: hypothetical protein AAFY46_06790, partial [Planctomycetota bacterium]
PTMESAKANIASRQSAAQLSLFTEIMPHPAVDRLREVNLDECSPIAAFELLRELRVMVDEDAAD